MKSLKYLKGVDGECIKFVYFNFFQTLIHTDALICCSDEGVTYTKNQIMLKMWYGFSILSGFFCYLDSSGKSLIADIGLNVVFF